MKLVEGEQYETEYGTLTYCGVVKVAFTCDKCGKYRKKVHEFYKNEPGDWLHFGSECAKLIVLSL